MEKEKIPKESETIAARRAARVTERIKKARRGLKLTRAWWSNGAIEAVGLIILSLLNFYLVSEFFGSPAPDTSYSGPIIPLLAKTLSIFGVSLPYAIQVVNLSFFLLFPFSIYLFVKKVTGRKLAGLLAVLFNILPIYLFAKVRIHIAFWGVEGPHVASLTVMPLATYGILSFLKGGGIQNLIFASFFAAIIALISPFGFLTFIIFAAISAFSEMLLGRARLKFARLSIAFFFAGALVSFWYNPAFFSWMIGGPLGEELREMVSKLIPVSFFILPVLGAFGFLLFDRKPELQPVFLATFYTIAFGIIVLAGGGFFPSHPSRYISEFGIATSFLASIFLVRFTDYIRFRKKQTLRFVSNSKLATGLLFLVVTILVSSILFKGRTFLGEKENVLGLWTGVERGQIWIERDKFSGTPQFLGYAITGGGIISLSYLGTRGGRRRD